MGKPHPSDEEINNYLRDGFRFYQKNVKKYTYIVIRKRQKMHSLGRYSDDLWQRILQLEFKFSEKQENSLNGELRLEDNEVARARIRAAGRLQSLYDKFYKQLDSYRGAEKFLNCRHKEGRFCEYWVWSLESSLYRLQEELSNIMNAPIEEDIRIYVDEDGTEKFVFRASIPFCSNCSVYEEKG